MARQLFYSFTTIALVLLLPFVGFCQENDLQKDSVSKPNRKLKKLILVSAVGYSATMYGLSQLWYKDFDKQSFAFFNDAKEWNQVDKLGHSYSTYYLGLLAQNSLVKSGVSEKKATHVAAITSLLMVSSIEIFDAYSSGYGASGYDLIANTVGSALFWGQYQLWQEQRIIPKFSFHRTNYPPIRPELLGSNLIEEIIKDYNGQTYWFSLDMDKFSSLPKWLNLAVGYGAEDFVYANRNSNLENGYSPYRQFYFGLDFDFSGIPTHSKLVKSLLSAVSMIRLPAPAVQISNGNLKFHPFYF